MHRFSVHLAPRSGQPIPLGELERALHGLGAVEEDGIDFEVTPDGGPRCRIQSVLARDDDRKAIRGQVASMAVLVDLEAGGDEGLVALVTGMAERLDLVLRLAAGGAEVSGERIAEQIELERESARAHARSRIVRVGLAFFVFPLAAPAWYYVGVWAALVPMFVATGLVVGFDMLGGDDDG